MYRNVRVEFEYEERHAYRIFHYLTKHQTRIPFAIEWEGLTLGVLGLKNAEPTHGEIMAAQSFIKNYAQSKVLMLHPRAKFSEISNRIASVPDFALF